MKIIKHMAFISALFVPYTSFAGAFVGKLQLESKKLFPTLVEKKDDQLRQLIEQQADLTQGEPEFLNGLKSDRQEIEGRWRVVTETLEKKPNDEFSNKLLLLLHAWSRTLEELKASYEKRVALVDEHIGRLKEFVKDPSFESYKEKHSLAKRDSYSLEYLQELNIEEADQKGKVEDLKKQKKNAELALDDNKLTAADMIESYRQKKKAREQVNAAANGTLPELFNLNQEQRERLFALEDKLHQNQIRLNEYHLKEVQNKIALIDTQLFLAEAKLRVIEQAVEQAKPLIRISEETVERAKAELAEKERKWLNKNTAYAREINNQKARRKEHLRVLQEQSKLYNVPLGPDLDSWSREPKSTIPSYIALLWVGDLNDSVLQTERSIELLEAQQELARERFEVEKVEASVKESYYRMNARAMSEEDIAQEMKHYDRLKAQANLKLSSAQNKKDITSSLFAAQNKILVRVQELRERVVDNKNILFKGHAGEYRQCLNLLANAEKKVTAQRHILSEMLSEYSKIIDAIREKIQQVNFIMAEIESRTFWYRADYAISLEGLKSVVPDLQQFVSNVRTYVAQFDVMRVVRWAKRMAKFPWQLFFFLLNVLISLIILFILKKLLPRVAMLLLVLEQRSKGIFKKAILWLTVVVQFVSRYLLTLSLWMIVWILSKTYIIVDPYVLIAFHVASIPYLSYLANGFIKTFIDFNISQDYGLVGQDFERRFTFVLSALLYANIFIFFFRQAFILDGHPKSELPSILLAISFISLQIAIISLMTKELVLSIIPTTNDFWRWLYHQVDSYYYLLLLFLVALIVLINPYVGFGKLVLYIVSRLIYTAIVLRILFAVHLFIKRSSSRLFFAIKDEVTQERFTNAKTWYGFCVIGIFITFTAIGVIVVAKLWGWPEVIININTWQDVAELLNTPIIGEGTKSVISVAVLLKIVGILFVGFVAAFAMNRFVLGRIFDVLLVDVGVQNAVTSITRYAIIFFTILFAFQSVGLADLISYLLLVLAGVGYLIKEPLSDFLAYFIILVQRPVKIGDYVLLEDTVQGVVRKITPRSVVLRRKNSMTVIVPNTAVISKALINWNYVRNFIAFDDIILTVHHLEDPEQVRDLLLSVVEEYPRILKNPKAIVRLDDFTEMGQLFMVRGYLSSNYTLDKWDIASDIRISIVKRLRENDIDTAMPTRVIVEKGRYKFVDSPSTMKE